MTTFSVGDKVIIKHQREIGVCIVVNAHDESDIVLVGTNKPVEYYVRIDSLDNKDMGYHYWNLELVNE